jgi:hypothetical protein
MGQELCLFPVLGIGHIRLLRGEGLQARSGHAPGFLRGNGAAAAHGLDAASEDDVSGTARDGLAGPHHCLEGAGALRVDVHAPDRVRKPRLEHVGAGLGEDAGQLDRADVDFVYETGVQVIPLHDGLEQGDHEFEVGDLAEDASDAGAAEGSPHVVNDYCFPHGVFSFCSAADPTAGSKLSHLR